MKIVLHFHTLFILASLLSWPVSVPAAGRVDKPIAEWKRIPALIDAISETDYYESLDQLQSLTQVTLGRPMEIDEWSEADKQLSVREIKDRWKEWWESTGKDIVAEMENAPTVDDDALQLARDFLGIEDRNTFQIAPVSIPDSWTLYLTYTNGDYFGREKEIWVIDRTLQTASLTKLRGEYDLPDWTVSLSEYKDFSTEEADRILQAICYLYPLALTLDPKGNIDVENDSMPRTYYPHATMHLRDGQNRILWNTEGYRFQKAFPKYGDGGNTGRAFYFLRTRFPENELWKDLPSPKTEQLAPYRRFLSFCKPYFSRNATDVAQLFGEVGGEAERATMLDWAEKQKAATNPKMDWRACSGDFNTSLKVNVLNFTRSDIEDTLAHVRKIGERLETKRKAGKANDATSTDPGGAKEKALGQYVANMIDLRAQEKEQKLLSYPQPLQDLVRIDETEDPNLDLLSAAVQKIRTKPNPELFKQLAQELDDGTLKMISLLNHILLNEHNILDIEPWGDPEEAIAVNACIDALPDTPEGARSNLIESILHLCGGGRVEYPGTNGGNYMEILPTESGFSMTRGGTANASTLTQTQEKLRQLYIESKNRER